MDTRPVSAQERATAEQLLERQQESSQKDFEDCLTDPSAYFGGDAPEAAAAWTLGHNAWGDANAIHITVDTRRIPEKEVKVPK